MIAALIQSVSSDANYTLAPGDGLQHTAEVSIGANASAFNAAVREDAAAKVGVSVPDVIVVGGAV